MSDHSLNEPWGPIVYFKAETNVFIIPFQTPATILVIFTTVFAFSVNTNQLFCLCFTYVRTVNGRVKMLYSL